MPKVPPNREAKRIIAIALLVIILLGGCGIQQGWVYAKHYYPAYFSYSSGYYTSSCSRKKCTSIWHPGYLVHHDAEYSLDISSCRHNVDSSECKRNTVWVDKNEYDKYSVGSYYGTEST